MKHATDNKSHKLQLHMYIIHKSKSISFLIYTHIE